MYQHVKRASFILALSEAI
jgi:hypothetical protein